VFCAILIREIFPPANLLLQNGIHDNLLADGVPRQLPRKLVLPSDLLVRRGRLEDVVVELLELPVVVLDHVGDGRHVAGRSKSCDEERGVDGTAGQLNSRGRICGVEEGGKHQSEMTDRIG
jgi:hypothetical protein